MADRMAGHVPPAEKQAGKRWFAWLAWALCALVAGLSVVALGVDLATAQNALWAFLAVVFAALALLILSRLPHNVIGWLLLTSALALALAEPLARYTESLVEPPAQPPLTLLLAAWFDSWLWLLTLFPIVLLLLLFPTGRPPSPRWRWLIFLLAFLFVTYLLGASFATTFAPGNAGWEVANPVVVANPVGFVPAELVAQFIEPLTAAGLLAAAALSVVALFVRYRPAGAVERQQIRWLLFACALFAVVLTLGVNDLIAGGIVSGQLLDFLFALAFLTIPAAVAIAVLRYRLYAIDIIIRRTLIYGALSLLLALVYFGSVVLLQRLFTAASGQQSPLAIVVSTLLIAVLFAPLRQRLKDAIDRRFYRRRYNAAHTLAAFAATCRDEVDLERLTAELMRVVGETMQPAQLSFWLRPTKRAP